MRWTPSFDWRRARRSALPITVTLLALAAGVAKPAHADGDDAVVMEKRARCATRIAIAIVGKSATPELLAAPDPQSSVDALLATPDFVERFARFANAHFNPEPGETVAEDASYTLAKFILTSPPKPWKDMFVGAYNVGATVTPDPNGLGYFRSDAWMKRYAGNELDGYRISAAYRMMQNTIGLDLKAVTNVDGADLSATGRRAPACAGCHYNGPFALDPAAKVLSRRRGIGDAMRFTPPTEGPQAVLDAAAVANDKELVEKLVDSTEFRFSTCRLAFEFLYGRAETSCEANVFDACVDALGPSGTMQVALGAIAKDPSFCQ